jgi:crotonobetainyl-CoA:carnitine CoA-transferase CaiB-like acyl-CoA transferase
MSDLVARLWSAVSERPHPPVSFVGRGTLDSPYAVSEFACAAIAVAGLATGGEVVVNRPLADAWFRVALRPDGWELPSPWDPLAGDYRASDGWVRIHTNAPHHRLAAILALEVGEGGEERERITATVANMTARDVEDAVLDAGGAAAALHTPAQWAAHPQGLAVAAEPLIAWTAAGTATREVGFKVLDLTRVIAGPVATRFLAGLGADVLRIDPPDWNEPAVSPEMTLGKRAARANFHDAGGIRKLGLLIAEADVIVHGYRADALDRLGLGDEAIRELNPGIVDVAIDAYGWTGPWRNRRGFDSLVQMSSGIAFGEPPHPLPVQALDHATGYLAAAAVLEGIRRRRETGQGSTAKLSLARTALELPLGGAAPSPVEPVETSPLETPWGPAELVASPLTIDGRPLHWDKPPRDLGTDKPMWTPVPTD